MDPLSNHPYINHFISEGKVAPPLNLKVKNLPQH